MTAAGLRCRPHGRLQHEGYLYRSRAEFVAGTVDFLRTGLEHGDAALVSVPGDRIDPLRRALAEQAGDVQFADMTVVGRNPSRIIPFVQRFAEAHPDRRVSFVGEPIWVGRSTAETRECVRHEALLNSAFADADITIFCPYDLAGLDEAVLLDAWRTHPIVGAGTHWQVSDDYTDPVVLHAAADRPLPGPPPTALVLQFSGADLPLIRRIVADTAHGFGLDADRAGDFVVAVNEVVTNTVMHAGPTGRLWLWTSRRHLICEVQDLGHIADPLVGRRTPHPDPTGSRGLWLVNQLCDLVELRSGPAGTTIRLYLTRH